LVVATPAVRCDERQYEGPALADQLRVSVPTALATSLRTQANSTGPRAQFSKSMKSSPFLW